MSIALEIKNLHKRYKKQFALKNIQLSLPENKIMGIVGGNGAGKTTLLKILAGLLPYEKGEVRLFGSPPGYPPTKKKIAFLSETPYLPLPFTGKKLLKILFCLDGENNLDEKLAVERRISHCPGESCPPDTRRTGSKPAHGCYLSPVLTTGSRPESGAVTSEKVRRTFENEQGGVSGGQPTKQDIAYAFVSNSSFNPEWLDLPLQKYSKGMLQRFNLLLALSKEKQLLLLDEPMSGLDPIAREWMMNSIKTWHTEGKTILLTSHLLADVEAICEEIAILEQGNILFSGEIKELLTLTSTSSLLQAYKIIQKPPYS